MGRRYLTLDYVRGFRCIGADCEDPCCHGWDLSVDRGRYEALAQRLAAEPGQRERFERAVRPTGDDDERRFARIELDEDGTCPFLDPDGLCSIHRRFGQTLLPLTCVAYPRVVSQRQDTGEIAGALSCPEMARRCLEQAHGGEPVEVGADELPGGLELPVIRVLPEVPRDPYHSHFDEVRAMLSGLVTEAGLPFETRLLRFAYFSHRLSAFYHRDCAEPGTRLAEERRRLQQPPVRARLDGLLAQAETEEPLAVMLVQALLSVRLQRFPGEAFSRTVAAVLEDYRHEVAPVPPESAGGVEFPPAELAVAFARRLDRLGPDFGDRIDHYLTRYLENCLHREWFVSLPDPFTYAVLLTVRLAVLRFLLHSHPDILALAAEGVGPPTANAELDRVAVQVLYRFSRAFDHDVGFQEAIYHALLEQDLLRFDVVPRLIRF